MRSVGAVAAGMIFWASLWVGGTGGLQAAMPEAFSEEGAPLQTGVLVGCLLFSIVLSVGAGYITAWVVNRAEIGHTLVLGVIQLAIGVFVQLQFWDLIPLWYHILFLALLIPGNVYGGKLRRDRMVQSAPMLA